MEKINSFSIVEVFVMGFKGFKEKQKFTFNNGMNIIVGDNGKGKTSIADAVAFAFMGTTFYGEKELDRLHNKSTRTIYAKVKFVDDTGEIHEIVRTRKDGITNIFYNELSIRQTDLNAIFGDKDLFLSMFNPMYFIEILGTEGKELLEKLLPLVKHEDILKELTEEIQEALEDEHIFSPEIYIKNHRAKIKTAEKDLLYLQGQEDFLAEEKEKALKEIEVIKNEIDDNLNDIKKIKGCMLSSEEKAEIKAKIENLHLQYNKIISECGAQTEQEKILELINNEKLLLRASEEEIPPNTHREEILNAEINLREQYKKYNEINNLIKNLGVGQKCKYCFHEITSENFQSVESGLKDNLQQCVSEGSEMKLNLKKLKGIEEIETKKFYIIKEEKIKILKNKIEELENKYEFLKNNQNEYFEKNKETLSKIQQEIDGFNMKLKSCGLTEEQSNSLYRLLHKKTELEAKHSMLFNVLDKDDYKNSIAALKEDIEHDKILVNSAMSYMSKKNEIIFKNLSMNKVKVVLNEVMKSTGEIKDAFKFSYEDKDYKKLSLSEKVKAGLEITELIKKLSERNYPTFIDNGESVSSITNVRPNSQILFSVVVKGKELEVLDNRENLRKAG